ncbi:hypothetical protein LCGC14_1173490, partial [marine sediment metagenome]
MNIEQLFQQLKGAGVIFNKENDAVSLKLPKNLSSELKQELVKSKDALKEYLEELFIRSEKVTSIEKRDKAEKLSQLSFSQQRLWFTDKLQGGTAEYNMPEAMRFSGTLDTNLVESVLNAIIERHEILRTNYVEVDGEPLQYVNETARLTLQQYDLSHLQEPQQQQELKRLLYDDLNQAFDLKSDLMFRAAYILLCKGEQHTSGKDQGVLLFNLHHIAADGWSVEIVKNEFFTLYQAFSDDKKFPLAPLRIQYADYAHWLRRESESDSRKEQLAYWQEKLQGCPEEHGLALKARRPQVKINKGAKEVVKINNKLATRLMECARKLQLTPFMFFHGVVALVLSRYSVHDEVIIGTAVANREHPETQDLVGFFANLLALRVSTEHTSLQDYFSHIKAVNVEAQANQEVRLEQIIDQLKIPRNLSHAPLFQIVLNVSSDFGLTTNDRNDRNDTHTLPQVDLKSIEPTVLHAKYDIEINVNLSEQGGEITWIYDTALFADKFVLSLGMSVLTVCEKILSYIESNKKITPHTLSVLPQNEYDHLLQIGNGDIRSYPSELCIHQYVEQQAARTPQAIAVRYGEQTLSYQQLDEQANQLAHYLQAHHQVGAEVLVGVCVTRSLAMVVGVLAILKAGGAYVPLDPNYPSERLAYMLSDAQLSVVLSDTQVKDTLQGFKGEVVCLDSLLEQAEGLAQYGTERPSNHSDSRHLAYVIYTSGSTGKPKGVAIAHRNTSALIHWAQQAFSEAELAKVLASTSLNFDLSVFELFVPLSMGGCSVIVQDALALLDAKHDISLLNTVPSAATALLAQGAIPESVRCINLAGEPLPVALVNQLLAQTQCDAVCNLYGPSEDTTYSTYARFSEPVSAPMTIGRVITHSQAYILDDYQGLCPLGSVGELYLGGSGVTQGYYNNPALTAERFIDNPFYDANNPTSSERLYKTGDLVRYLADGQLEFLGRIDDQVKIRGFRIELGEIEAQLVAQSEVESALVVAKEVAGSQQLVGYVRAHAEIIDAAEQGAWLAERKAQLQAVLPQYMVPATLLVISQWPLTPNGKIDKKALPSPDSAASVGHYEAPAGEIEWGVAHLWAELLGRAVDEISAHGNFFDLGGHSLLTTRLVAGVRNRFAVELSVQQVFEQRSLRSLAEVIGQAQGGATLPALCAQPRAGNQAPLSYSQQRLWFIDQLQGAT